MTIEDIWPQYRSPPARLPARTGVQSGRCRGSAAGDLGQGLHRPAGAGGQRQAEALAVSDRPARDHRHYRKGARAKSVHPGDLWYANEDSEVRQDLERCVEPFIQSLPEETARMLTAIDLQGMSQRDYAEQHGLSYSTLKSRVPKRPKRPAPSL